MAWKITDIHTNNYCIEISDMELLLISKVLVNHPLQYKFKTLVDIVEHRSQIEILENEGGKCPQKT